MRAIRTRAALRLRCYRRRLSKSLDFVTPLCGGPLLLEVPAGNGPVHRGQRLCTLLGDRGHKSLGLVPADVWRSSSLPAGPGRGLYLGYVC